MPHRRITALALALALVAPSGCASTPRPVSVSRPALGTIVTIDAYGTDETGVRRAIDEAFATIADVEAELNAYSATSTVAAFNATPFEWHELPADAGLIFDAVDRLGVGDTFSPYLLGVERLYDFGGANRVPTDVALSAALHAASMPERDGARMRFRRVADATGVPGLDFGGAAKGLALEAARDGLRSSAAVTAALISAGSTTVTLGTKPDAKPWRVGVEDPRKPNVVRLIAEWTGEGSLSTSGDYQQFFERDGVRYHHILDPKTGAPARGIRSLTVVGRISGTDSDVLSTALFVDAPDAALAYARRHGLAVYIIDSEGRTHLAPAPADSAISLAEQASE
ncbi:MAG: FAD:protein FMN transferase [Actinomycetia bacterium]|nr:FAD:protein FMN transferase [Actinomycetes bacterium]